MNTPQSAPPRPTYWLRTPDLTVHGPYRKAEARAFIKSNPEQQFEACRQGEAWQDAATRLAPTNQPCGMEADTVIACIALAVVVGLVVGATLDRGAGFVAACLTFTLFLFISHVFNTLPQPSTTHYDGQYMPPDQHQQPTQYMASSRAPGPSVVTTIGACLLIGGLILGAASFWMDPTVPQKSFDRYGGETSETRIYNLPRAQQQTAGLIASAGMAITGAVLLGVGMNKSRHQNGV